MLRYLNTDYNIFTQKTFSFYDLFATVKTMYISFLDKRENSAIGIWIRSGFHSSFKQCCPLVSSYLVGRVLNIGF